MSYTTVVVVYEFQKPSSGHEVILGFFGGNTKEFTTDSSGTAYVQHESTGRAEVFVDGRKRDTINAPGKCIIYL